MSTLTPLPTHAYTLLSTPFHGPTGSFRQNFMPLSSPTVLLITPSFHVAVDMLAQYKQELTSRQHVAQYAVAMWRDMEEGSMPGVDIMLTPREGNRTVEVRLRVVRGEVVMADDGKGG